MTMLGPLDWAVVALFLLGMAAIVVASMRAGNADSEAYMLAGRDAGWIAIGASIFASNIGSEHLVGLAGAGAENGLAMAHWELQGWLILLLGWVFVPIYWRSGVFTMPEFLERRYSSGARTFLSFVSLVSYVLTKVSVTVYAGGLVIQTLLGIDTLFGIDFFWIAAFLLVAVTGIYTVAGGMRAIMWTSLLQTPVLLAGSLALLFIGLEQLGGWSEFVRLSGDKLSLFRPIDDPDFPWPAVLGGSIIIGFWYWCTDQYIVQRVLSGRNIDEARRGAIVAAWLKMLPVFIFLIPGMIGAALASTGKLSIDSADAVFPAMVGTLLPAGFKGLIIGGLLAALMSSLASLFNSSATLFTMDFYQRLRPEASQRQLVYVGRVATAIIVLLGLAWIPLMMGLSDFLYGSLQLVQGLVAPSIAAVFLLGVFWPRANSQGAMAGLVIGFALGMGYLALRIIAPDAEGLAGAVVSVNWLYICCLLFLVSLAIVMLVSLATQRPDAQATSVVARQLAGPINRTDAVASLALILVTAAIYLAFW